MFSQLFTWWNSTTFGTSFTLWSKGARLVGTDEQGNRYFEEKEPSLPGSDGKLTPAGKRFYRSRDTTFALNFHW